MRNKEHIRKRRKELYKHHIKIPANVAMDRERKRMMYHLGSSKNVPAVCKKILAINRAVKYGIVKTTIKPISEGKTYEAYL